MRVFLCFLLCIISPRIYAQSFYLFVGTYTDNGSKGIYIYRFDASTGKAVWITNTDSLVNPSFLTIAPDKKHIYAVTETATNFMGSVSAFAFDSSSQKLTFINKQPSGGANPCYITLDKASRWAFVGNYTGGSLAVFPLKDDGGIQQATQVIQHTGSSIHKSRQDRPHVHCTLLSPDQKYLFVADLGLDKIMTYAFNRSKAEPLAPANIPFTTTEPGSGPRHITFHPNNQYAYLLEEMKGAVVAYRYKNGKLTFLQSIDTHPPEYTGIPGSADIHISPDGKFLYASNRGEENNIAIFSINAKNGLLTLVGYEPTGGKTPRNFTIDPTGKYLLVANQNSNNIVVFKRDIETGLLTKTGEEIQVPKPVCLKMMD